MDYELIVFDVDGTLANRDSSDPYPQVKRWFETKAEKYKIAIATNQGGVGLRYWMEEKGFGEPEKYPTEDQVWARLDSILENLGIKDCELGVCFAYQAKSTGNWGPVPDDESVYWKADRRKPAPGMIYDAIQHTRSTRAKTLMVGDREEDRKAAENAGVDFQLARVFFGRA